MKKFIALLLAAMMLCCACTAFAADKHNIAFDESMSFDVVLPEGYTCEEEVVNGILTALIFKDVNSLSMMMLIAADDDYPEVDRLNSLEEGEKAHYISDMLEDWSNPTYSIEVTGLGTEVLVIDEQSETNDLMLLATIYDGYDVVMYVGYEDGHAVSADDLAVALQFFTDLDFVKK